jgi:hypothetical protein
MDSCRMLTSVDDPSVAWCPTLGRFFQLVSTGSVRKLCFFLMKHVPSQFFFAFMQLINLHDHKITQKNRRVIWFIVRRQCVSE